MYITRKVGSYIIKYINNITITMQQCNICPSNHQNKIYNYHVFSAEPVIEGLPSDSGDKNNNNDDDDREYRPADTENAIALAKLNIEWLSCDLTNKKLCKDLSNQIMEQQTKITGLEPDLYEANRIYNECNNKVLKCQGFRNQINILDPWIDIDTTNINNQQAILNTCGQKKLQCDNLYNEIRRLRRQIESIDNIIKYANDWINSNKCTKYANVNNFPDQSKIDTLNATLARVHNEYNHYNRAMRSGSFWRRWRNYRRYKPYRDRAYNQIVQTHNALSPLNAQKNIFNKCKQETATIEDKNVAKIKLNSNLRNKIEQYDECIANYNKICSVDKQNELMESIAERDTKINNRTDIENQYKEDCSVIPDCTYLKYIRDNQQTNYDSNVSIRDDLIKKHAICIDPRQNLCSSIYTTTEKKADKIMTATTATTELLTPYFKTKNVSLEGFGFIDIDMDSSANQIHNEINQNSIFLDRNNSKLKDNLRELNEANNNATSKYSRYATDKQLYDKTIYTNILLTTLATSIIYYVFTDL